MDGQRSGNTFLTLSAIVAGVLLQSIAIADEPEVAFDIESQELGSALSEFALQSGKEILFVEADVAGKSVPGISGRYAPTAALEVLLADSKLNYRVSALDTVLVGEATGTEGGDSEAGNGRTAGVTARQAVMMVQSQAVTQASRTTTEEESVRAEEKAEKPLEEIVVTGTNIRGLVNKTAPIVVMDREYIESTGLSTATRLLESLPQNFASASQSVNSSTPGVTADLVQGSSINLRGLGEGTTLILLNGRRIALGFGGAAVDISALPLSAIERVEVMTDGASAIYGSDAVGGVVNFVLREEYQGAETRLDYGWADGADEYRLSQALGTHWDGGNVVFSGELYSRDLLRTSERDFVPDNVLVESLLPEDDIWSAMLSGRQAIGDAVEFFADALYMARDTRNRGERTGVTGPFVFDGSAQAETRQLSATAGLDWRLGESWKLQVSGSHGFRDADTTITSRVDLPPGISETRYEIDQVEVKADGTLFELPGGPVRGAIGGAWRAEDFGGQITTDITLQSQADQEVNSLFGEINVPFIGGANARRGLQALELSIAARYDDYSNFGSSTDPRVGLAWEPARGLRIRGSWGTSYVAPKLTDYDSTFNASAAFFGADPGLPSGVSYQLFVAGTDIATLGPQESESYAIGLEFMPQAVPTLRLGLNYFDIDFSDRITNPPSDTLVLLGNPDSFGTLFMRDPTDEQVNAAIAFGEASQGFFAFDANFMPSTNFTPDQVDVIIDIRRRNLSQVATRGVDFSVQFEHDTAAEGSIHYMLDGTYLLERPERVTALSTPFDTVDTYSNPPAFRARGGVGWQREGWAANGFINYTGDYTDNRIAPFVEVGSFTTVDASVNYRFAHDRGALSGLTVALSAQNLLDRDPPSTRIFLDPFLGTPLFDMGFDPANASPLGRLVSLQLTKTW